MVSLFDSIVLTGILGVLAYFAQTQGLIGLPHLIILGGLTGIVIASYFAYTIMGGGFSFGNDETGDGEAYSMAKAVEEANEEMEKTFSDSLVVEIDQMVYSKRQYYDPKTNERFYFHAIAAYTQKQQSPILLYYSQEQDSIYDHEPHPDAYQIQEPWRDFEPTLHGRQLIKSESDEDDSDDESKGRPFFSFNYGGSDHGFDEEPRSKPRDNRRYRKRR